MVVLRPAQYRGTLLALVPAHWQPLVEVLAGTGIRWGEAAALDVGDVDVAGSRIRVKKAVKRDADKVFYVGRTKTGRSMRWVDINPGLLTRLRPLLTGRPRTAALFTVDTATRPRHGDVSTVAGDRVTHAVFLQADMAPRRDGRHGRRPLR